MSKMARRRARELALQGVYQWLLSGNSMTSVQKHLEADTENLDKVDRELFVSLLMGAHELRHNLETPYRVVINEAIELAKGFGGTDGHRFVNGVLDKLAANIRPEEVEAARAAKG